VRPELPSPGLPAAGDVVGQEEVGRRPVVVAVVVEAAAVVAVVIVAAAAVAAFRAAGSEEKIKVRIQSCKRLECFFTRYVGELLLVYKEGKF
jgi:hypothetical protein